MLAARSILFVPGNRPERFTKAASSSADAVCLDLEDGVPNDQKKAARHHIASYLKERPEGGALHAVRINSLNTTDYIWDVLWLNEARFNTAFIALPKVESRDTIRQFRIMTAVSHPDQPLFALLETARGLEQALAIGGEPGVVALGFGSADYAAQTGGDMGWDSLAYPRGRIVQAAAANGIQAIDGTMLSIDDTAALEAESRRVAAMGFAGRAVIHPRQIDTVNRAFSPRPEEVERAQRLIAAYQRNGGGAFKFDGRMIDAPVIKAAQRILAIAERISSLRPQS